MCAARPLLTLFILGLAPTLHAQSAGPAGQDAGTPPAADASTATPDLAKPVDGQGGKMEPGTKGSGDAKAGDSSQPGMAPPDGKPAEPGVDGDAKPTPAVDTGLLGREGELLPQLPRLVGEEEVTWLEAEGKRFFVFKRAPKPGKTVRGALVLVPAPQAYIDQRPVTRALREDPLAGGYHTFALQPSLAVGAGPGAAVGGKVEKTVAEPDEGNSAGESPAAPDPAAQPAPAAARDEAQASDLCARLGATIAAAAALEPRSVALVAEQQHIPVVLACFADGLPPEVQAFVAIGGWQGEWPKLTVPSLEFLPVLDPVARREAARRARTPPPAGAAPRKQVEIDGRLDDAALEIARRLRGWLDRLPAPTAPEAGKPKTVSG